MAFLSNIQSIIYYLFCSLDCFFNLWLAHFKYLQLDKINSCKQRPKKGGSKWRYLGFGISDKVTKFLSFLFYKWSLFRNFSIFLLLFSGPRYDKCQLEFYKNSGGILLLHITYKSWRIPMSNCSAARNGKKSPGQETGFGNRGRMKVQNDTKLVLN